MNNLKVEGKVSDICPKCKNCKDITRESNGVHVWLTEVECEDPYDGMTKTLDADSDIRCSMFEPKPDKSCENGIYVTTYMGLYEEKKEKEPCDKISLLQHELEMERLRTKIHQLEKEKAAHLKGIERLKKSQEKLRNQVKNLQSTNEESYKREEKLEDKVHKLERRLLEENKRFDRLYTEFLLPLARVLYPGEKVNKPYSDILEDIKLLNKGTYDLKEDNKRLVDKNKELEERYHKAETDITILNSKVEVLDRRNTNQYVMIGERDKEIENLKKMVERRDRWVKELQSDVYSLQNEILTIRNIAQKAYDDTNRD